MHEMSVALDLVEAAAGEAHRMGGVRVVAVHLRLGPLAGVVEEALRFSFGLAATGTAIEGARLEIEHQPAAVWCAACERVHVLPSIQLRRCPVCERPTPDVVSGEALMLTALEIVDDAAPDR